MKGIGKDTNKGHKEGFKKNLFFLTGCVNSFKKRKRRKDPNKRRVYLKR